MYKGLITTEDPIYKKVLSLRYTLFFREHQLPIDILFDEHESNSSHVVITKENCLIAYGRLSDLGEGELKISQVVVEPELQGRGYGKALLKKIIEIARVAGAKSIQLNARTTATKLYSELGFREEGGIYKSKSTNVPHIKMILEPIA
jgi:predicted GNAT family N-acyltransferase